MTSWTYIGKAILLQNKHQTRYIAKDAGERFEFVTENSEINKICKIHAYVTCKLSQTHGQIPDTCDSCCVEGYKRHHTSYRDITSNTEMSLSMQGYNS